MSETEIFPELYLRGIQLFNDEEFFECHDVLEELWTDIVGHERRFYQGLIQVAVSLYHFGNSNFGGARKLYHASREKLEPYAPMFIGMDLKKFLLEYEYCFQEIIEAQEYPKDAVLHDDRIPKIELTAGQD